MSLKKSLKKSIALFIATSLVYSNCYLCGIGLSEVIAQSIKAPEIVMNIENSQYVQYCSEEYEAVAMQSKVQIGITQEEIQLPIKKTEVAVNLPVLNGYLPERASVVDCDSLLTSGKEDNNQINQNYDSASGLLTVSYESGEAYSNYTEETKDEFEIIYIYPAGAYTGNEEDVELGYTIDTTMTFYAEEREISSQKVESFVLQEKDNKGGILTFDTEKVGNEIYKGFMYSNIQNGTNYKVEFNTVSDFCVLDAKANNEVELEISEPEFITNAEEDNLISSNGLINLVETKISKTEFDKILGQEGYIEFYQEETIATIRYIETEETTKLAVIYSDGSVNLLNDEEIYLTINYPENMTSIKIKTSTPIAEGYINFENKNVIKATDNYGEDIANILGIKLNTYANEFNSNTYINLLEPQTKIAVASSNTNFSTLQKNNTTLTINLDDTNYSTKLFNNPIIKIKLPDGLVSGNLASPQIVNGNGLNIKNATVEGNNIIIELEGKQVAYDMNNVSGGTTIVMDIENMDFEDKIPTHEDKIEVTCIQGKEKTIVNQMINIVSKPGLLMLSSLSNFDETNTIMYSISNELKTIEIEENAESKEVVEKIVLVNNYDEDITNVEFIGRLGYTDNDKASTFDLTLAKEIEVENGKVYYSTNKDAAYNDDSWTEEFINEAKAYKIEFNNKEIASKNSLEIKLNLNIPANIEFNQATYVKTEINYTYSDNNITDSSIFGMLTKANELLVNNVMMMQQVTNIEGQDIPVTLSIAPNITQNYVHSGQLVTYKIKVTNNGVYDLNNLTLIDIIPENAVYTYKRVETGGMTPYYVQTQEPSTRQKEWTIDVLKGGEIQEFEIMLTMAEVNEEQAVNNIAKLEVNGQEITSQSEINLKPAVVVMNLTTISEDMIGIEYDANEEVIYYINVKNISDKKIKDIKVQYELPSNLEYIKGELVTEENTMNVGACSNNIFEYNIEKLDPEEEVVIGVHAKVMELELGYEANINTIASAEINGDIYESNIKTITTKQAAFEISMSADTNGKTTLVKDDVVIYSINVKNVGLRSKVINIEDNMPEQLEVIKLETFVNGENDYSIDTSKADLKITKYLEPDDEVEINITAKVKTIEVNEPTILEVINKATLIKGDNSISSNEVKINIRPEVKVEEDYDDFIEDDEQYEEEEEEQENYVPTDDTPIVEEEQQPTIPEGDGKEEEEQQPTIPEEDGKEEEEQQPTTPEEDGKDEEEQQPTTPEEDGKEEEGQQPTTPEEDGKEEEGQQPVLPEEDNKEDEEEQQPTTPEEDGKDEEEQQPVLPEEGNKEENKEPTHFEVSGFAWLDENKNGQKDENEKVQQNVTVSLVDMSIGNFALDSNGNRIITKTNSEGKYTFNNIKKGSYIVLFEFDTNTYSVTTYKKEQVNDGLNSDVILSTITIDGQQKLAALTDKIEITSNKENINIGLIENPIFDLSLDKKITKITVINSKETKEYEYEDEEDMAKVDLVAKYMSGSNVIVTYKFTITNEGDVTGYVNSLVDNLPTGLEFSSELNTKWYKGSDGKLYTTSLSGTEIKPGESISIDLVLNKIMTEDNAGIFPNSAELEKISNLENIQEKEEDMENNQASATLLISIKTGSVAMYAGITALCLLIICIGTYLIKKKVLNRVIL